MMICFGLYIHICIDRILTHTKNVIRFHCWTHKHLNNTSDIRSDQIRLYITSHQGIFDSAHAHTHSKSGIYGSTRERDMIYSVVFKFSGNAFSILKIDLNL